MRPILVLLLLLGSRLASAQAAPQPAAATQTPASQPQPASSELSPQAAYAAATRPLDITRRAVENWSDVEVDALKVATGLAKDSCLARAPFQFAGEDLIAYARLCAFARQWEQVQQAAANYLAARSAATPEQRFAGFPSLALAFDFDVLASLQLKDTGNAFVTAEAMLRTVPYGALSSEATNTTVRYMQLIQTDQALALLRQRQVLLLSLLRAPAASSPGTPSTADQSLTLHELYADALALPAMQQFANRPGEAAASFAELEAAVPASLSPDDAIPIAASRRQYLLLGSPLPAIAASASLADPSFAVPGDLGTRFGAGSVFLLFPDWCAQCIDLGRKFHATVDSLGHSSVRFLALLAQANPQPPAPPPAPGLPAKPSPSGTAKSARAPGSTATKAAMPQVQIQINVKPTAAERLVGTPTLIVPNQTLDDFAATDFPLIIAVDHHGIVRYIGPAPDNALESGGLVEQIADRILEQWPPASPN